MNEKNKLKVTVYLNNSEYEFVNHMKKLRLFQTALIKSLEKRREWLSFKLGDVFILAVPDKEGRKLKKYTIQLRVDSKENKELLSFLKSLSRGEASLVFKGAIKYLMDLTLEEIISGFKEDYTKDKKTKFGEKQRANLNESKVGFNKEVQRETSNAFVLASISDFKATNSNKPEKKEELDGITSKDKEKPVINDDTVIDIKGLFGGLG